MILWPGYPICYRCITWEQWKRNTVWRGCKPHCWARQKLLPAIAQTTLEAHALQVADQRLSNSNDQSENDLG